MDFHLVGMVVLRLFKNIHPKIITIQIEELKLYGNSRLPYAFSLTGQWVFSFMAPFTQEPNFRGQVGLWLPVVAGGGKLSYKCDRG